MEVGFVTPILDSRWATSSGWRPSSGKPEEEVRGALLGWEGVLGPVLGCGASIFGLYENKDDMICVGGLGALASRLFEGAAF
jgi:hypothetical protein